MDDEQQQSPEAPEPETPEEEAPEQQVPDSDDQAPTAEPIPEDAQDEAPAEPEPPATDAPSEASSEAEQPASEAEVTPEPEAAPEPDKTSDGEAKDKKDVVPGAELDPIAIESDKPETAEERARREAEEEERATREAAVMAEAEEEAPVTTKVAKLSGDSRYLATGKRKSSVARVMLTPGSGAIEINKRKLEEYFPRAYLQSVAKQPLVQSGYEGNVDVRIRVHGGGISGQAAAVRHGIARALVDVDPELRVELKRRGMLTRDARVKERRKAGLKKARKKPQFSKR